MIRKPFYLILSLMLVSSLLIGQIEQPIIKSFPASEGDNLNVDIDPGNIDVEIWNKSEVKIEVISKRDLEVEELVAEKSGNTIKFVLETDDGWNNNITVKVNSPAYLNFNLESTGGNINVSDDITGKLRAETQGGNINFNSVKGEVIATTNGGNISGENVEADVKLHTNGGNISLGNVKKGKSDINTYGGNISIGSVDSDLSAKTHGGHISVGDVGGNAVVFTYGGHINVAKVSGHATMETYGGHLNLEGASGKVIAKTMGGHISLDDISGSIDASTKGGHVSAQLDPKSNTSSSLETMGGNLNLMVPGTAKATIEVFIENDELKYEDPEDILKSDFPSKTFEVDKDSGELKATYELNGGGSNITLNVVGGDVKIENWSK